ncbi:MAG: tyrosine-type recombinase/integrase, partial [Phycisphaeraceae bacterium]|nr:tyrosine-type recombinase/integrase [Phycisphaeraceae bacterium]
MRVFKADYTTRAGEKAKSKRHYLDFRDHLGIRHKIPAFSDRRQSEALGRQIDKLLAARGGEGLDAALSAWLEMLPARLMKQFVSWGLIESHRAAASKTLTQHLADFKLSLLAGGCTEKHAGQKHKRVERVFALCGYRHYSEIAPSKLQACISLIKTTVLKKVDGVVKEVEIGPASAQTKKHYLSECKAFCRWMVQDRRANENPLIHLKPLKVDKSQTRQRRALEPEEVVGLLGALQAADVHHGMTGYERAILYRLATETGLRALEIRSLKVSNIDLKGKTIMVFDSDTKNRQGALLPLRQDMCEYLSPLLQNKHPEAQVFNLPSRYNMADMLRADLALAGIDPEDTGQGLLDFHSLRHTFGSLLAASGVHHKIAQDLMRHSDINLTMTRYTHTLLGQGAKAVESLPDFSHARQEAQAKTGTDDMPMDCIGAKTEGSGEGDMCLASCLAFSGGNQQDSADFIGQKSISQTLENSGLLSQKQGLSSQKAEKQNTPDRIRTCDLR